MTMLQGPDNQILPQVLHFSTSGQEDFDVWRLREALSELSQRSLIMYSPTKDSYTVHPIVHTWICERPEMRTGDQAVWCQAAATILTRSILLPPLAMTEQDENFRRDLLPHLTFVRRCEEEIKQQFLKNQQDRKALLPLLKPRMGRDRVLSMIKHSLVYSQCGLWKEAEELQRSSYESLRERFGPAHAFTIRIQLALAGTYWQLGRGNDAADHQNSALENSIKSNGKESHTALKIMDSLGVSRWQQGHYTEAVDLHITAIDGLIKVIGQNHEDTLRAKDHLGVVYFKYFRFEDARKLHQTAVNGLTQSLGPTHPDTLTAMENLALTHIEIGGTGVESAQKLIQQVLESRTHKLGKEHPYTLLALLNLARVKEADGHLDEAQEDVHRGLLVAYKNLGPSHIGVLAARSFLGVILFKKGKFKEAEEEMKDVIERQRQATISRHGLHPDFIMAMSTLADILAAQDCVDEAIADYNETIQK